MPRERIASFGGSSRHGQYFLQDDDSQEDPEIKAEMLGSVLEACKKAAEITDAGR